MAEENEKCNHDPDFNIFPKCPRCGEGVLLPFSFKEDVFEKWKCSNPECGYVVKKHER